MQRWEIHFIQNEIPFLNANEKNIQQNGNAKIGNPQSWQCDQSATEQGTVKSPTEQSETTGGDWYCPDCEKLWKMVEIP